MPLTRVIELSHCYFYGQCDGKFNIMMWHGNLMIQSSSLIIKKLMLESAAWCKCAVPLSWGGIPIA